MLKRTQQAAAPHLLGEDITRGPHLWQRSGTRGSRRQRAGELRCCQFSWKTVQKSTAAACSASRSCVSLSHIPRGSARRVA